MIKGNLYYGSVGVGKTTRLRTDYDRFEPTIETKDIGGKPQRFLTIGKDWLPARKIVLTAQKKGIEGIEQLAQQSSHLFIDDLGHEITSVSHFGTVFSPMTEFILTRYDYYASKPLLTTHFTTNLTADEIAGRYGDFVLDRLVEMCEWMEMKGKSFRK